MKTVCLYMEDCTTDFLRPLCNHICSNFGAIKIGYDTSGDDDPLELIYQELRDAQTVFSWTWYEYLFVCKYSRQCRTH